MTKEEMNRYEEGLRLRLKIETLENTFIEISNYLTSFFRMASWMTS